MARTGSSLLDYNTMSCYSPPSSAQVAVFNFMPAHPLISVLLAAWLGLSGSLCPRLLCICADGTATIEVGRHYCCVGDESRSEGCAGDATSAEFGEACSGLDRCPQGCSSTMLAEDVGLLMDRPADQGRDLLPPYPVPISYAWIDALGWTPSKSYVFGRPHGDARYKADSPHLRSVILLV